MRVARHLGRELAGDGWGAATPARGGASASPSRRPDFDEQALISAAQHGDLPAFNQIILHYQGLAYNVAYRIVGDADSHRMRRRTASLKLSSG